MTIHVELTDLIKALAALIVAYFALVKIIVWQFNKSLDVRFAAQEEIRQEAGKAWTARFKENERRHIELEKRFNEHVQQMPDKYQRREDAIRQEVAIVSRLDGLAETLGNRLDRMENKIDLRSS